jgi:hypothetical protein
MEVFAKLNPLSPFPLRRLAVTVTIVFYAGDKESEVTHVTDSRPAPKITLSLNLQGSTLGYKQMIPSKRSMYSHLLLLAFLVVILNPLAAKGPKMEPEELVARHLAALGSPEARSAVETRAVQGNGRMEILSGGSGFLEGPAVLASQGRKLLFSLRFGHVNYAAEQVSFDGDQVYAGNIEPGVRSQLGQTLYQYEELVEEGLFGGVLSTAWPLLDLEGRNPKLDYRELRKVDGKELLELRYRIRKGGGDVNIRLYFDPESFRHMATTYKLTIAAPMGRTTEESARQSETRLTLEEWFSDFRTTDDLDLPTQWTVRLTVETGLGNFMGKWNMTFPQVIHNPSVDPQSFVLH